MKSNDCFTANTSPSTRESTYSWKRPGAGLQGVLPERNKIETGIVSGPFTHTYLLIHHMIERTSPAMFAESPGLQRLENNGQRAASIYRLPSRRQL